MKNYKIESLSAAFANDVRAVVDRKTKPLGSLGRLEDVAIQIGQIQHTTHPVLTNPTILVFAADHGIALEGVSAYPQEVTWQMVSNFLNGGAAINVFCKQHAITLKVIDAGVNYDFDENTPGLIQNKAGKSTHNFLKQAAMSSQQVAFCLETSAALVDDLNQNGCTIVGFGEMGIANTSSASVLMSLLCNVPLDACIGRGTGLDDKGLQHKRSILSAAIEKQGKPDNVYDILSTYGGFEIAQMAGAMLRAAELRMVVMIDGFIASVALLTAQAINPAVKDYCIICHQSAEHAHASLLNYLNAAPLINLGMRLGEGSGVAVAFPLIQSAVNFLNEMASFESAGVTDKE